MSSTTRDMVEGYEEIARDIQRFMWTDKPLKSEKKEHTVEELEGFLERIRQYCWSNYDSGAYSLGWKD